MAAFSSVELCDCGHHWMSHWLGGTSENIVIPPGCTMCKCQKLPPGDETAASLRVRAMDILDGGAGDTTRRGRMNRQRYDTLEQHARHWVAPSELARYEGCDKRTVLRMIAEGSIAAYKCGAHWRIPLEAAKTAFTAEKRQSA